ncbi:hypothetical protein F5Y13DRAFT_195435 [Hypoxylon sp. FL1857]|nr:hypothetical protein F5Y13DRAFT_195435 [Hypoxylon sp. FL1857]
MRFFAVLLKLLPHRAALFYGETWLSLCLGDLIKIVAEGGGTAWPMALRKALGVKKKMNGSLKLFDANLLHAVLTHSTNWATIAASHVPPRTRLALKNRYSTLRLRHENENKRDQNIKKSIENSPSSFEAAMAACRRDLGWNSQVQMHPTSDVSVESDEDDDDDDDEDNEEDDGDEGNRQDGKVRDGSDTTCVEMGASLSGATTGIMDVQMQEPSVTLDSWTGFTERSALPPLNTFHHGPPHMPIDSWASEMANPTQYEGLLDLTTGENYLCGMDDPSVMGTGLPYKSYVTTPTDITFSDPMGFHGLTRTIHVDPSIASDIARSETSPPPSSRDTPPLITIGNSTSTTLRTSISGWGNHSANYQVCVNMTCSGAQIESVMVGLAGLGTCTTMKIDIKEDS